MKPAFFPVIMGGRRGSVTQVFSPASLFTSGVQGAWYDPSDYTTLFQDSAGTTAVTAVEQPVGKMLDKSGNNNHASQATTASRPVLRARYNLLTYSEQFDNTAWTSSSTNVTISANTATAPDATTTADSITAVAGGPNFHYSRRGSSDTLTGTYTYSIYVKKNTSTWIFFTVNDGGVNYFNLDTGAFGTTPDTCAVVALSNGWYRISATRTLAAAPGNCGVGVANSNGGGSFTATGTESVYVWGAMLNPGSSAGTYQQITTATSYATTGFLPYLALVTDDSMATGSIDFSATDKMYFSAGVTKLGTSTSILAELSANTALNAGSFYVGPNVDGSTTYTLALQGTAGCSYSATSYSAPITNTISVQYNIGGSGIADKIVPKVNGATPTLAATGANAGTGNFGNYPLYIGRRNNASLPFDGRIYQMVVVGKTLSASELASTEAFVNTKTGAY